MQILYDETERAAFEAIEGQPDRVVGIVAGSILENRMADLIKAVLRPDVKVWNEVFTGVGPAAPYSVKLKLAYLSKLIDKETFDDLNYIRKIRNLFAHKISIDSFNHPEIDKLIKRLLSYISVFGLIEAFEIGSGPITEEHAKFINYFRSCFKTNKSIFLSVCAHCIIKIV